MYDSIKLMKMNLHLSAKTNKKLFYVFFYPICMSSMILTSKLTASIQIIMCAAAYAVYGIVVGLIATEENMKSSLIFQSIPVKKRSIVIGKFLFSFVIIIISCMLSSIIPFVKSAVEKDASYFALSFINSLMFCIVLVSIFFPLYYKMGYLKMHLINLIIFYGLIFIPIILNLLKDVTLVKPIIEFVLSAINIIIQNMQAALVVCLVMYAASIFISIIIEENE